MFVKIFCIPEKNTVVFSGIAGRDWLDKAALHYYYVFCLLHIISVVMIVFFPVVCKHKIIGIKLNLFYIKI